MSGRKNVLKTKLITGDLSANFTSDPITADNLDCGSFTVQWTGSMDVSGVLLVEVRQGVPLNNNTAEISPWVALDFGSPITIAGASGTHRIDLLNIEDSQIQIRYAYTAGTSGSLGVWYTAKSKGN